MELLVYRKFAEREAAEALLQLLQKANISAEIVETGGSLDSMFVGTQLLDERFFVKIKGEDFKAANELLEKQNAVSLVDVERDHYLYQFTDEELVEILSKPDEWSSYDYQLASAILKERGKEVTPETAARLKKGRLTVLALPEKSPRVTIYVGYLLAVLGGLLGVFIGWHLITYKKTLPDGSRYYGYRQSDRQQG